MTFIKLEKVNVEFPIYNAQSFSIRNSFLKAATGGSLKKKGGNNLSVSALKNISFSLKHGDRLGLIGHNGSGKTTLLKLLGGIYSPASGKIQIKGKIATLFDILLGTYEDMTGFENLYISSVVRGKSISETKKSLKTMAEFTELGDYLYVPMRTYSAGMKVRVGFAVATEGTPEILLIDEVFGAGDKLFTSKAVNRLLSLIERSGILVFSTHSESLLRQLCNKVMLLEHGEIKAFGETEEILSYYKTTSNVKEIAEKARRIG